MTLYQRLGGSGAIIAVVEKFYQIMLKDDRVAHYFANTNMEKQKQRQVDFITLVTGGPNNYNGTDMKTAHCKHAIGHMEFDATWENLQKALHFFSVPDKEVNELKQNFYSVQSEIVNKKEENQQKTEKTLYEKLGGKEAVSLVVNKFYEIMLKDSRVSHYFAKTDMQKQKNSQVQFISMVTGGPAEYKGKDMIAAHCPYKIGHLEFDVIWQNLKTALEAFSVPDNLIEDLKDIFYSVEGDIVTEIAPKSKEKCPFHKQQETSKQEEKNFTLNSKQSQKKPQSQSLYDRLGGHGAVYLVANKFYDIMLEDPKVKSYFSKTDMEKQKTSQIEFISMVTGGPNNYRGKDMRTAHCPYKIGHPEFDATWENLEKAFAYFKVDTQLVNEVKQIFYSVEGEIVTESAKNSSQEPEKIIKKEVPSIKQPLTITSQGIVPVILSPQQALKTYPYKFSHQNYEESEMMKCPHMQEKLKEIQLNNCKLSENEKRKMRQEIIHKEEDAKQVKKLSNDPYQKVYY